MADISDHVEYTALAYVLCVRVIAAIDDDHVAVHVMYGIVALIALAAYADIAIVMSVIAAHVTLDASEQHAVLLDIVDLCGVV